MTEPLPTITRKGNVSSMGRLRNLATRGYEVVRAAAVDEDSDISVFNEVVSTKSIGSGKADHGMKADVGVDWGGLEGLGVVRG